ncbi:MAG: hypothetical protein JSS86_23810 [Cyanobacteria bacterium SZAS LIN-2]|nr:hypothetical protein [Cyanobacteria bacterium SZAS LIN-2]
MDKFRLCKYLNTQALCLSQLAFPFLTDAAPVSLAPQLPELPQKSALQPLAIARTIPAPLFTQRQTQACQRFDTFLAVEKSQGCGCLAKSI